jgi:SAM-dependent methyltransferase
VNGILRSAVSCTCLVTALACGGGGQGRPHSASAPKQDEVVGKAVQSRVSAAALLLLLEAAQEAAALQAEAQAARAPDVVFVGTPAVVVDKMLEVARVEDDDVVYDLGCGDGRIVIAAAERYGVEAWGFDIDPERVAEARENARAAGVEHLVTIEQKDIFELDLSPASVVTLYLLPELNVRLIPQLEKMRPGSRVVSHDFDMEGVTPLQHVSVRLPVSEKEHQVYLWQTPLLPAAAEGKTESGVQNGAY